MAYNSTCLADVNTVSSKSEPPPRANAWGDSRRRCLGARGPARGLAMPVRGGFRPSELGEAMRSPAGHHRAPAGHAQVGRFSQLKPIKRRQREASRAHQRIALAMEDAPANRKRLIARLRNVAMTRGPLRVRT